MAALEEAGGRLLYIFVFLSALIAGGVHSKYSTLTSCDVDQDGNTLEFLFMTSFGESLNSSGNAVGMMLALDRINANSSILPDYNLTCSSIIDTQVSKPLSHVWV